MLAGAAAGAGAALKSLAVEAGGLKKAFEAAKAGLGGSNGSSDSGSGKMDSAVDAVAGANAGDKSNQDGKPLTAESSGNSENGSEGSTTGNSGGNPSGSSEENTISSGSSSSSGKQIQQIHPLHQERKVVPKGRLLHQRHLNQLLIRQAIIAERRLKRLTPHQKQLIPVEEVLLLLRWVVIKYQIGRRQKRCCRPC